MDTIKKLEILSASSQYDLACACGTKHDEHRKRGADGKWLYPLTLPGGGHSIMLKTLLSNACVNDCKYCPLRRDGNMQRVALTPDELAKAFMEYLKTRRDLIGMFLSSGVLNTPDHTMDKIIGVASLLRKKHRYRGYLHLKVIPGASDAAVQEALSLASAVSINIETPGERHFNLLSEKKNYLDDIIRPLKLISKLTAKGMPNAGVKATTQFIVGASDETDSEIVKYLFGLYNRLNYDRIYFSAYQRGLGNPNIPGERFTLDGGDILTREHRLYQADFLVRLYGFEQSDILFGRDGNLDLDRDPKQVWADLHPERFPVRVNGASREELLKVPGLGVVTVDRLLKARGSGRIQDIARFNVKGKRLEQARKYLLFE